MLRRVERFSVPTRGVDQHACNSARSCALRVLRRNGIPIEPPGDNRLREDLFCLLNLFRSALPFAGRGDDFPFVQSNVASPVCIQKLYEALERKGSTHRAPYGWSDQHY
jgi:hypothetical protein